MSPPFSRISITLPRPVLAAADRLAKRLDRSRSWVVAEALRRFVESTTASPSPSAGQARERLAPAYQAAPGLGEARLTQLEADLQLSPEERVRLAEQTARVSTLIRPQRRGTRFQSFDRYEDYLAYKREEEVRGR